MVKSPPDTAGGAGDASSISRSGRTLGVGNGNPLQFLAWKIPWTEPGRLQSLGHKELDVTKRLSTQACKKKKRSRGGRGAGRRGVRLSTQIHQDHIYRCNSSHLGRTDVPTRMESNLWFKDSQFGGFEICFVSLVTLSPSCKLLVNFLDQCYSWEMEVACSFSVSVHVN